MFKRHFFSTDASDVVDALDYPDDIVCTVDAGQLARDMERMVNSRVSDSNVVSCKVVSFNEHSNIIVFEHDGKQYQTNEARYDGASKTIAVIYDGNKFTF